MDIRTGENLDEERQKDMKRHTDKFLVFQDKWPIEKLHLHHALFLNQVQGSQSHTKSYILIQNAKSHTFSYILIQKVKFLSILNTISYFLVQLLYLDHLSDTVVIFSSFKINFKWINLR